MLYDHAVVRPQLRPLWHRGHITCNVTAYLHAYIVHMASFCILLYIFITRTTHIPYGRVVTGPPSQASLAPWPYYVLRVRYPHCAIINLLYYIVHNNCIHVTHAVWLRGHRTTFSGLFGTVAILHVQ